MQNYFFNKYFLISFFIHLLIIFIIFHPYKDEYDKSVNYLPIAVNIIKDGDKIIESKPKKINNSKPKVKTKVVEKISKYKAVNSKKVNNTFLDKKQLQKNKNANNTSNFNNNESFTKETSKNKEKIKHMIETDIYEFNSLSKKHNHKIGMELISKNFGLSSIDNHYLSYRSIDFNKIKIIPEYPRIARIKGIEGKVILILSIDKSMKIIKVTLDKSSGHRILDYAALEAARKIKNKTFLSSGLVLPAKIKIPITFQLSSG
jgi:TonB family C-terminal domain